jgi:hypothetical protein
MNAVLGANLPELREESIRAAAGRQFVRERQLALTQMIVTAYEGRRKHKRFPRAATFSRDWLTDNLRTKPHPAAYQRLLAPLFTFAEGNRDYSRSTGQTKPYFLKPHVSDALDAVFRSDLPSPVVITDERGKIRRFTSDDAISNGIPAPLSERFHVPAILPVSPVGIAETLDRLQTAIGEYDGAAPLDTSKPNGLTLTHAYRQMLHVRKWSTSIGGIPNTYTVQSNGRLGYSGCSLHVIQMPSAFRHLLFSGSGLVDYDIASAHWAAYISRAKSLGIRTKLSESYVANKEQWHSTWAEVTRHSVTSDLKAIALSWLNGATLSSSKQTAGTQRIGREAMKRLAEYESGQSSLYNEVREGMSALVQHETPTKTKGRPTAFVNAVQKKLIVKRGSSDYSKICSHLLTGWEQFAVREICSQVQSLGAVCYDGVIAPAQSTDHWSQLVRDRSAETLGFPLDITIKATPFTCPLAVPRGEPTDF